MRTPFDKPRGNLLEDFDKSIGIFKELTTYSDRKDESQQHWQSAVSVSEPSEA